MDEEMPPGPVQAKLPPFPQWIRLTAWVVLLAVMATVMAVLPSDGFFGSVGILVAGLAGFGAVLVWLLAVGGFRVTRRS
jgi:hypothetical protein